MNQHELFIYLAASIPWGAIGLATGIMIGIRRSDSKGNEQ